MNLEDIARRAGVSKSTVSRVINGEAYVSTATREKVLRVINEVNYHPDPSARALAKGRTQVIGVVIPHTPDVVFEDSYYFPTLLQGISEETDARDYAMLLWMTYSPGEEARFYRRVTGSKIMDGLIVASAENNDTLLERILHLQIPCVLVERPSAHFADQLSYATVDNKHAAQTAVEHLLGLGRKRVGTITGALANTDGADRLEGYLMALRAAGIVPDERIIAEGYFNRRSGYLGMKALVGQGVDAVFAASDMMALGAMDALRELNLRVPEDVAVIGFDDLPQAIYSTPTLSTVRHPIRRKGARAAALLVDLIEGKTTAPRQVLLPTQLVIRQSCGGLKEY